MNFYLYLLPGLFITSTFQEGSRHVTVVDEEFIPLKENRVQSAVEDFTECPVLGMEQEIAEGKTSRKMEQDITSSKTVSYTHLTLPTKLEV